MTDPGTVSEKYVHPLKAGTSMGVCEEQRTGRQKREPSGTPVDFQKLGVVKIIP